MSRRRALFPNLPLFWKVLVPFLALMVLVGALGVFLIVRDLSSKAQSALDRDLSRRAVDTQALVRDRELYLVESANFAANVERMSAAIKTRDEATIGRLLQSVLALKPNLALVAATDVDGVGLVEFTRAAAGSPPSRARGTRWSDHPFVVDALTGTEGNKTAGFLTVGGRAVLGIAAPICTVDAGCASRGVAIVAVAVDELASAAALGAQAGVALYDLQGKLLARGGRAPEEAELAPEQTSDTPHRRMHHVGATEFATLYSPFVIRGSLAGTLTTSIPTEPAFSTVRGAGIQLAAIVLVAMAGIVALGALLSRSILAQVRPLVETNRALGRGDLSVRAPVFGKDELGELAQGVNLMAEQLQASYETLELRAEQRTDEVRRLLRDRTEFFAGLSHELRTPLAVILIQAKALLATSSTKADLHSATDAIQTSASELLRLVNDILDLAEAESTAIEMTIEPVDLGQLLNELEPTLLGLGSAAHLDVDVELSDGLPSVIADHNRLREVFVNLVDNAVKYTPAGGRVVVSAIAQDGCVTASVTDTGVGIPAEAGDRIFEPFYRVPGTRPQRSEVSTGLGLALTRRWIDAQGGTITWRPNPGGGTIFEVVLPAASGTQPPRAAK